MQLAAFNHNSFLLGQAAMMVNEGLPAMLVEQTKATYPLQEMRAAILGMAFKGDNDDHRDETPPHRPKPILHFPVLLHVGNPCWRPKIETDAPPRRYRHAERFGCSCRLADRE